MSGSRDREMQVILDSDVQAVLEFMQDRNPAARLLAVAEGLPKIARLLWDGTQQEPFRVASLTVSKTLHPSLSPASELSPALGSVDGDSVTAAGVP